MSSPISVVDDSPASSAGASASAAVGEGSIIDVAPPVGENDNFNENFVDNYELDAEGGDEYTLCQKMLSCC